MRLLRGTAESWRVMTRLIDHAQASCITRWLCPWRSREDNALEEDEEALGMPAFGVECFVDATTVDPQMNRTDNL